MRGALREECIPRRARPGVVEAHYSLEVDFGFPVPALVLSRIQREVMRRSVRELKARVEARS